MVNFTKNDVIHQLEYVDVSCLWTSDLFNLIKVIGVRPLAPVQNSVSLKLMQRKTLNFVTNLPDVENITDSILTKVSIIKRFYTLEFILSVQSQICSILNIAKLRQN